MRSEKASHDRSAELVETRLKRDAAAASARQFERHLDEQAESLQRLRAARNGSALERMAALC